METKLKTKQELEKEFDVFIKGLDEGQLKLLTMVGNDIVTAIKNKQLVFHECVEIPFKKQS